MSLGMGVESEVKLKQVVSYKAGDKTRGLSFKEWVDRVVKTCPRPLCLEYLLELGPE